MTADRTWQLELIIERATATGLGGGAAVSHAYGLAQADQATQDRLGRQLADAGVSLVTAAVYNFRSRPSPDCAPPESPSPAATTASATCGARGVRLLLDGVISPRIGG